MFRFCLLRIHIFIRMSSIAGKGMREHISNLFRYESLHFIMEVIHEDYKIISILLFLYWDYAKMGIYWDKHRLDWNTFPSCPLKLRCKPYRKYLLYRLSLRFSKYPINVIWCLLSGQLRHGSKGTTSITAGGGLSSKLFHLRYSCSDILFGIITWVI